MGHWRLIVVVNPAALTRHDPPVTTRVHSDGGPSVSAARPSAPAPDSRPLPAVELAAGAARPPAAAPDRRPDTAAEGTPSSRMDDSCQPPRTSLGPAPARAHVESADAPDTSHDRGGDENGGGTRPERTCRHCAQPRATCACVRCPRCRKRVEGPWQCTCIMWLDEDGCPLWYTDGESSEEGGFDALENASVPASLSPRRMSPADSASPPHSPLGGGGGGGTRVPAGRVFEHDAGVPRGPS